MSLYNPQYKDGQGNIVDLPINAKKLDGYSYNEYSKYYTTSSTTENAFLVTIPYVKALSDGLVIHCQFHASTKSGATLNVNNLGAKGICYRYDIAITTQIAAYNYVDLIYSASIRKWVLLFSYDSNSNSIGYQVRTNNALYRNGASTSCYRYQIVVETNNGLEAFTSTNNSTETSKAQLSPNYIPNGTIRYYSGTAEVKKRVNFSATKLWQQYQGINLKYSFNIGTITMDSPCYIKMSRNTDGTLKPVYSATSGGHPLVFALPTTKDGYYYTYLGRTYPSSSVVYLELELCHPTFYYDGGIRVYDGTYLSEETVSNWGFTKNTGTVTSVRVQAGTGLSSSTSTAQTSTLDTTISIASGYKLLTNSEYSSLNVNSDWNATTGLAYIKNKPDILPIINYTGNSPVELYNLSKGRYINATTNDIALRNYAGGGMLPSVRWRPGEILTVMDNLHSWVLGTEYTTGEYYIFSGKADSTFSSSEYRGSSVSDIANIPSSIGLGGPSTPLYIEVVTNEQGKKQNTFRECKSYGGGTGIVKINGYDTLGKSYSSIFAPETAGEEGQILKSNGYGVPVWETVAIPSKTSELTNDSGFITGYTSSNKLHTDYINNAAGWTSNKGTVTSIRVQAGTGLSSSTSTAQTSTLDTTISIADGYKLLTTTEYNNLNAKQDKISGGTNGQLLSTNGSSLVWTNDNRGLLHHDLNVEIPNTTTDSGWKMFNSSYTGYLLKSVRFNDKSPAWGVGNYGSGIVFGGVDTKGVVSVAYGTPEIKIAGGNGSRPRWWIGLTGTSATSYDLDRLTYAPTTAGTSGYSLKSNGSGAPRWANVSNVQVSGTISSGAKNNASVTFVITDSSKPLRKGVWRYSGTHGVFLIFATTEITSMGSPRTEYICGYVSSSISNNTEITLVEV